MTLKCAYCFYSVDHKPIARPAEFVINGQSVCEDHVDTAAPDFHLPENENIK